MIGITLEGKKRLFWDMDFRDRISKVWLGVGSKDVLIFSTDGLCGFT